MVWNIKIINEAKTDFRKLDGSLKKQVAAGIIKVSKAPLPAPNGYGKPLGNKSGNDLTGFFKIKYRGIGIRVVYTLVLDVQVMNIVVISERDDNYCYDLAAKMYAKYGEKIFADGFDRLF
ncbi:MAG: type II toxin-antitoxin system RelE/ParE family toxin [Phascolarctobacterium sp.]|nr:type II toxin-antitoxin system RelE/ParE family toxin [Phascolarctobacterium sp.]